MTNIDIMDETGAHSSGYSQDVIKVRLDSTGVPIQVGEPVRKLLLLLLEYAHLSFVMIQ